MASVFFAGLAWAGTAGASGASPPVITVVTVAELEGQNFVVKATGTLAHPGAVSLAYESSVPRGQGTRSAAV